jgi:hypothetical protein
MNDSHLKTQRSLKMEYFLKVDNTDLQVGLNQFR